VQSIAREIRDEMGPDATLGPAPLAASGNGADERIASSEAASWKKSVRDLEERMERLERLVNTAVNLLHRTLLEEQRTTQPGTPVKR
jgi:hypothetical protein